VSGSPYSTFEIAPILKNNGTEMQEHVTMSTGLESFDISWDLVAGQ